MNWVKNRKLRQEGKIPDMPQRTIDVRDALDLENHEKIMNINRITRHAIGGTYKSKFVSKNGKKSTTSFTKKRRKLPGKRKWKDKDAQYSLLRSQMHVREFNAKQKAQKAIERIFKQRQKEEAKEVSKHNRHNPLLG